MKKKQPKAKRRLTGSGASARRSERSTTRSANAPAASKQPTPKRPSRKKPITRSGVNPKKSPSGLRAPVARVSFKSEPTLSTRVLKKVVGDLLRDELQNHTQWLLQQHQVLLQRYFGNGSESSRVTAPLQAAESTTRSESDFAAGQSDSPRSQSHATTIKSTACDEGTQDITLDRFDEALEASMAVSALAKEFKKYKPLHYLLMMYAKKAVVGTQNVFQQTDTGWPSSRSIRKMLKSFVRHNLIQGYGEPISIDPELIMRGKRKTPYRFKGYQLTDLGVAAVKLSIPWIDAVHIDLSRKPVQIPKFLNRRLRLGLWS